MVDSNNWHAACVKCLKSRVIVKAALSRVISPSFEGSQSRPQAAQLSCWDVQQQSAVKTNKMSRVRKGYVQSFSFIFISFSRFLGLINL